MRPVAWATGSMKFSVRGYEVPSEPSEPSGIPGCFRQKVALLLMIYIGTFTNLHYTLLMINMEMVA